MKWFRHHVGMCRDDKLVRVAVKAEQPVERVVWVFAAMLESACEIEDGGRFDLDPGEVAYFLRCDKADIEMIIACLTSAERIKGNRLWNWDSRQYVSDSSAGRVRKHRERKAKQECNGDETLQPVTVTPPETETETDITPESTTCSPPPKGEGKRVSGRTLPQDWVPKENHFAIAREFGANRTDVEKQASEMRDWAYANANRAVARKADWDLTFNNWLKKNLPQARTYSGSGPPRNNVIDAADTLNARIRERYNAEPDADRYQQALPSPDRW